MRVFRSSIGGTNEGVGLVAGRIDLKLTLGSCTAAVAIVAATTFANAADLPARPIVPVVPAIGSFSLFEGVEVHGQVEAGFLGNANNPTQGPNGTGYNFGALYTDHAGVPQLNQAILTITKPVDPQAKGYAFGFTAQGLYGTDMRSNHFLGIGTFFMGSQRAQLNVIQGFGAAHLPWFTAGGVDVKVGLFTSPQGYETLDASTSPFYSHSYTYYYSVTFNHTGILTTTHVNDKLDIWLGIDTGNQTSIGYPNGDPNGVPAGFVGFGLNNLLNNKLTILALSHLGPEQAYPRTFRGVFNLNDPNAGRDFRFYNDIVFTYKVNDRLTSVTELNYFHDDYGYGPATGGAADSYSAVQYFSYALNKAYTLNVRGEIYRDRKNFTVSTPTDNSGIARTELGIGSSLTSPTLGGTPGGPGTTFASGTLGITFKPDVPKPFALLAIRPEVRYDQIVAGSSLYGGRNGPNSTSDHQFLFGGDVILGF